jgi:uncharacterized membrane protein
MLTGDTLVVEKDAALPDFCIFSGEPTQGGRVRQKLAWAPPALAALVVISPLIYIIVYLIVRKTGTLDYALSPGARSRKRSGLFIALGGVVLTGILIAVGADSNSGELVLAGLVVFLVTLIVGVVRARVLNLTKIDKTHIHVKLRPEAVQAFSAALARAGG